LKPVKRRELVRQVRQAYQLSEKRACGLMRITRWSNRYQSRRDPQTELRIRLRDLAGTRRNDYNQQRPHSVAMQLSFALSACTGS
jgi:putative transposase